MGLDQYAYIAARAGQRDEFYEGADFENGDLVNPNMSKPIEIAYWRKHPNLQGWMEQLWIRKLTAQGQKPEDSEWGSSFNGVELELTREDIDELEQVVTEGLLPNTQGFFFGNNSDDYYKEHDLEFCRRARADLFSGLKVFYNSSW
jgi:hypothetical protein